MLVKNSATTVNATIIVTMLVKDTATVVNSAFIAPMFIKNSVDSSRLLYRWKVLDASSQYHNHQDQYCSHYVHFIFESNLWYQVPCLYRPCTLAPYAY